MSLKRVELREVMVVRPLPGLVVGLAPEAAVVGRARIGIERHRIVGPDAVAAAAGRATRPPAPGRRRATAIRLACTKGTRAPRMDQPLGEFVGGRAAVLVERGAALLGQALDAGLDGDAAGRARAGPACPASTGRCGSGCRIARSRGDQRLQQRLLRQEDLVDEVDVGRRPARSARRSRPARGARSRRRYLSRKSILAQKLQV